MTMPQTADRRPVALLFSDDSTLIFARRMRAVLRAADPELPVQMLWYAPENALSYRQMCQHLPEGPDRVLQHEDLTALLYDPGVRAVITSRVFLPITDEIKRPECRWLGARPCVLAFLGGLDFFPKNGFARRQHCDGVFIFPRSAIKDYQALTRDLDAGWQEVGFGHPSALMPDGPVAADLAQRRDIYFFTQAISPLTRRSRLHMLEVVCAIARANPERGVYIKLRHLPRENTRHLHTEQFDYPGLLKELGPLPENLHLSDVDMDTALQHAAIGLTCTSTAALDVVQAGVPCMVYLDYVDAYRDPLAPPMRRLFKDSNLITSLEEVLHLRPRTPDPDWLADMFCPPDLGREVLQMITRFEQRAFQIGAGAGAGTPDPRDTE